MIAQREDATVMMEKAIWKRRTERNDDGRD